ncbi:MAG: peptide chain release factor 1 [Bacillota bacterium]|nr:peptide chain release factor 1 [Bacillota bacterium]
MHERLEQIEQRYIAIGELLSDPEIAADLKRRTTLSKEQRALEKIVVAYRSYRDLLAEIEGLSLMKDDADPDIRAMAESELSEAQPKIAVHEEKLKTLLSPKDPSDEKNVIVEIRGAAGGDEANIFAGDLFRMYVKYAEAKGWKIDVLNAEVSEAGGYSQIEFMVNGDAVYSLLKFESGVHRVQRVPATEASGRIHTSTATVLALPEAEEFDFDIDPADVRIDTFCSSGPGGQSVNTTKSAIRLTYVPTGLIVQCQDGKSQHENKASAFRILRSRLYDIALQEKLAKDGEERKSKIGTGDRAEKVRTYNYPQNRVTDHRINFTIQQLDRVMEGKLDPVIEALLAEAERRKLQKTEE